MHSNRAFLLLILLFLAAFQFFTIQPASADDICEDYDVHLQRFVSAIPVTGRLSDGRFDVKEYQDEDSRGSVTVYDISYTAGGKTIFTKKLNAREFDTGDTIAVRHTKKNNLDALQIKYINPGSAGFRGTYVLFASNNALCYTLTEGDGPPTGPKKCGTTISGQTQPYEKGVNARGTGSRDQENSPKYAATNRGQLQVSFDGLGPVKIGMTTQQAAKALGVSPKKILNCSSNSNIGLGNSFFTIANGRIMVIELNDDRIATVDGARSNMTEGEIKRIYPNVKSEPDKSNPNIHYLTVSRGGSTNLIIFDSYNGKIGNYRVGSIPYVFHPSECD